MQGTAITLTFNIGAAGSWRLGGTMVMVFYVLCVVVCVRGNWFLDVRHVMCMCAINFFIMQYFSSFDISILVLDT